MTATTSHAMTHEGCGRLRPFGVALSVGLFTAVTLGACWLLALLLPQFGFHALFTSLYPDVDLAPGPVALWIFCASVLTGLWTGFVFAPIYNWVRAIGPR